MCPPAYFFPLKASSPGRRVFRGRNYSKHGGKVRGRIQLWLSLFHLRCEMEIPCPTILYYNRSEQQISTKRFVAVTCKIFPLRASYVSPVGKKDCAKNRFPIPVLMPSVSIHAPVVSAALIKPLLKSCFSLDGSLKFWMPPWTEITSFGNSICHSFTMSCNNWSILVS